MSVQAQALCCWWCVLWQASRVQTGDPLSKHTRRPKKVPKKGFNPKKQLDASVPSLVESLFPRETEQQSAEEGTAPILGVVKAEECGAAASASQVCGD